MAATASALPVLQTPDPADLLHLVTRSSVKTSPGAYVPAVQASPLAGELGMLDAVGSGKSPHCVFIKKEIQKLLHLFILLFL
jgi:hypothetical protein